jgi:hypothetical protein
VSKLKFKYKKTIKEAEFAHANLEYHEEVVDEAKRDFKKEVSRLFEMLPEEVRKSLVNRRTVPPEPRVPDAAETETEEGDSLDVIPDETEEETEECQADSAGEEQKPAKTDELKKVFRKIAAKTHPDKLARSSLTAPEKTKRIKMFKKAKNAFNNHDWYTLYQIALELGIELPEPSSDQIMWLEGDIKRVRTEIAHLQNLTAWHWYQGGDAAKDAALRHYFKHTYNFDYPNL